MTSAANTIKKEILQLKNKVHVDKEIIRAFLKRLKQNKNLTKETNPQSHFCSFFLPINRETKTIYLGHHIKADDWIPPGGHIKEKETPLETVYREFYEELNHKLIKEKIKLYDLSIKYINKPSTPCKVHYDFWYLVFIKQKKFLFDRKEFYQARWINIEEALTMINAENYQKVISKLIVSSL